VGHGTQFLASLGQKAGTCAYRRNRNELVKLLVVARAELIEDIEYDGALLLEGSWPEDAPFASHWSLDEAIDADFEWIDSHSRGGNDALDGISPAYLNALGLRYYLVKLIRVATYFSDVQPLNPRDSVILKVDDGDEDYIRLFNEICNAAEADLTVCRVQGEKPAMPELPPNRPWRRLMASGCRLASRVVRLVRAKRRLTSSAPRVVLCGNPRLLQPVCDELIRRGCRVFWLCDRFGVKQWLGGPVEQLTCDSSLGRRNRLRIHTRDRIEFRGVNIAGPIRGWLRDRMAMHGARQTRMVERIERHFNRIDADAIILDEDATPLARAAVAVARRHGCRSFVVQHGAPCCRFGFSPLAADRILAWGGSSRQTLTEWGVSRDRISEVGSPQMDRAFRDSWRFASSDRVRRSPRILMLATTPPRDRRPDAVALQLASEAYRRMLKTAFSTLAGIDGARLIVKLHPRCPRDPMIEQALAEFPDLDVTLVGEGCLEEMFKQTDCVLSCCSSAGVEAAALGVPVIQLEPPGAADILPHEQWNLIGSVRNTRQLQQLLIRVLLEGERPNPHETTKVFANTNGSAAEAVVDRVLGVTEPNPPSHNRTTQSSPLTPNP